MCLIEELISQGALLDLRIKEELLGSVRVGQHSVQCLSESGFQDPERGQWHKRQDHNSDFERANFGLFRDLLVRWLPGFQRSPASAEKVYPKHREQERGTLFSLELTDRVREKTQTEIQIPPEHKKTFFFSLLWECSKTTRLCRKVVESHSMEILKTQLGHNPW